MKTIDRDNDQDNLSDTSEDASSTTGSIFSDTGSASSSSSLPGLQAIALRQKLAELFANEATIREIFSAGLNTESVGAESITTAFRRSLRTLGKELLATTASPEKRACAKSITRYARYIADSVRRVCDPAYKSSLLPVDQTGMSAVEQRLHIANMLLKSPVATSSAAHRIAENQPEQRMDLSDSDDDTSDVDNDGNLSLRIKEIEGFILNSEQLYTMNDRLHFYISRRISGRQTQKNKDRQLSLPELVNKWLPSFPRALSLVGIRRPIPYGAHRVSWTCVSAMHIVLSYPKLGLTFRRRVAKNSTMTTSILEPES